MNETGQSLDAAMRETIDYLAVRRLQDTYADVVSRRDWPALAELFLPDTTITVDRRTMEPIRLTGPAELGEFIGTAISGLSFFQFVILNSLVTTPDGGAGPDTARSRMYISELRLDRASGRYAPLYGVYHDTYRRVDGRWWFASRLYHSLARQTSQYEAFDFPEQPAG